MNCCSPFPGVVDSGWDLEASGGGSWQAGDGMVTFNIADSYQCGSGSSYNRQTGLARIELTATSPAILRLSAQGLGEDKYEEMTVKVDDVKKLELKCSMIPGVCVVNTCNMCPVSQSAVDVPLSPGTHSVEVEADTKDGAYHLGAFFTLFLSNHSSSCTSSCQCPL